MAQHEFEALARRVLRECSSEFKTMTVDLGMEAHDDRRIELETLFRKYFEGQFAELPTQEVAEAHYRAYRSWLLRQSRVVAYLAVACAISRDGSDTTSITQEDIEQATELIQQVGCLGSEPGLVARGGWCGA